MVGPAMDCLNNPLGAVRILFQKECARSATVGNARSDWGVKELFDDYLRSQQGGYSQVPEINSVSLGAIPNRSLVRFRGMVQDMFDIEYYLGAYKDGGTWRTTKYTDASDLPVHDKSDSQVWDRRVLYCVPVPGESKWVKEAFSSSLHHATGSTNGTREIDNRSEKRPRETLGNNDVEMDSNSIEEETELKRVRGETGTCSVGTACQSSDLNMPLGESSLLPCLVKVYDGADSDLKLNDVVEFTGVLTFDPELSVGSFCQGGDTPDCFMEENLCSQLPASRVPRLHCITYRKLSLARIIETPPWSEQADQSVMLRAQYQPHLFCQAMEYIFPPETDLPRLDNVAVSLRHHAYPISCLSSSAFCATPGAIAQLRDSLLKGLIKVLGGDHLAAEYLLLHLLSQVHHRVDSMALGKISLNLAVGNMPSCETSIALGSNLSHTIELLLPCSHLIPLSLETLNKNLMAPRKDYTRNRLVSGSLQLAEGTYLILDETAMSSGQLTAVGIQNIQSLKHLMDWQKVEYDFEYYKLEMSADVPVLVISHAKSRLLPADILVPLDTASTSLPFPMDSSDSLQWRTYLNSVRNMEHSLEPSMQKIVEEAYVEARQHDRSLTAETFHRWLTMAKLLSLSYGETSLTNERWTTIREMERVRERRIRS